MTGQKMKFDYAGFLGGEVVSKPDEVLNRYEQLMKQNELIHNVQFYQSEMREGFSKREGGVEIFLPKHEINPRYKGDDGYLTKEAFMRLYTVKVINVDRKEKRVTVSYIEAQKTVRPSVIEAIESALEAKENYKTQARIVLFSKDNNMAFVDILGLGIRGVVFIQDWSSSFVTSISSVAKIGDIIPVAITGHSEKSKSEDPQYVCSRKLIIEENDPWQGVEERIPLHSNILLRCVSKMGNNFIGKIDGEEELTLYVQYPEKPSRSTGEPINIQIGGRYMGYITKVSEKRHILRARVLDEVKN